ncbi:EVE domain-containing protein [Nitrosomonas sp. Nm51]|uniref:EVE domain-containing protein n=1 Tax=Nitrosomonas sp. Nm51 TaxID=133720 RepID=UPI000B0E4255|nr:EVE domain-containing protein [Nitrosomonas sp. Nm51]
MRYWLMKSEPYKFSIDDLAASPGQTTAWDGVRNYQARNFMWKQMRLGDQAFFYHSCCAEPGITGIAEISTPAYPDGTQFDPQSRYYDPKASQDSPRWFNVEITLKKKTRLLTIRELRQYPDLERMRVLQTGNRLSITPVDPDEWKFILQLLKV